MTYEEFRETLRRDDIDPSGGKLYAEWTTGGQKGHDYTGHDYGDYDEEQEPPFHALDKALLLVVPSLPILLYKAIERELVHYGCTQRDSYYGQHEELAYKQVSLIELHAWLTEKGLLA